MPKSYINAVHIVAKLLAESSYNYGMSGGMGWYEEANPEEILAKIYNMSIKKVRRQIKNRKEIYLKRLWNRRNR